MTIIILQTFFSKFLVPINRDLLEIIYFEFLNDGRI